MQPRRDRRGRAHAFVHIVVAVSTIASIGLGASLGSPDMAGATGEGPPTVTAVSPSTGTVAQGTTVTVTGTGLTGATAVHFRSVPASGVTVTSSTQLTAVAPAGVGTVTVTVTTPGGTSATAAADQFTYPTGELVGWGTDADGELADGSTTAAASPVAVGDLGPLAQVSSRATTTLALTPSGNVYAWGTNASGQLGNGTTTNASAPVEVEGVGGTGVLSGIVAVAEGEGSSYALTATGHVDSWGNNYWYGELGNGSGTSSSTPVVVEGVGGTGDLSNVVAIAAGVYGTLALTATGTVMAWGRDTSGQLGAGTLPTTLSRTPVEVEGVGGTGVLSGVVAISTGAWSSYALTSTGHVDAWGTNSAGQLGDGTTTDRFTPVEVEGVGGTGVLSGVVAMVGDDGTPLALTATGHVDAWGANDNGQVGDGTTTNRTTPVEVEGPGGTGDLSDVEAVGAGGTSSYALTTSGVLYAWGTDGHGQLGDGTTTNRSTPVEVKGVGGTGHLSGITAVTGGTRDAYALVAYPTVTAVSPTTGPDTGGTSVTITGTDLTGTTAVDFGLTPATSFTVTSPTTVTATAPAGGGTVTVVAQTAEAASPTTSADRFTYTATAPTVTEVTPPAGTTTGGTEVTIIGTGLSGATAVTFGATAAATFTVHAATRITATTPAGTGTVTVTVTTPGGTSGSGEHFTYTTTPTVTAVSPSTGTVTEGTVVTVTGTGFTGATAVHFGQVPASGMTVTSSTQLTAVAPVGVGTVTVTVTTPGGTSPTSSADRFTYPTGELVGWGTDADGELADGSTTASSAPVEVGNLGPLAQVSSRATTTLALTPTGHVDAWGTNASGQLGNGTTTNSSTPVEVEGVGGTGVLSGIVAVAEGVDSSYALGSTGHVFAWGNNYWYGELGNGSGTSSSTPVEVEGAGGTGVLSGIVAIAAGDYNTLALTATGTVMAWGRDTSGQLGTGTLPTTLSRTPVQVEGVGGTGVLSGVVAISAGGWASYALSATGHVYAWGTNYYGQLGDGTTTTRFAPVEVKGVGGTGTLSGVVAVNAGAGTPLALTATGHVDAWGAGTHGLLGDGVTTDTSTPVEVKGAGGTGDLSNIAAVVGGGTSSYALSSPGALYAWGAGGHGQLGNATTTDSSTPVQVKGVGGTGTLSGVLGLGAGGWDAYALVPYPTVTLIEDAIGIGSGEAAAHNPTCPCTYSVNPASGDFSTTPTDASTGGHGTAAALTRIYNSLRADTKMIFGYGWTSSYTWSVAVKDAGRTATVTEADGSSVTATETGNSDTYDVPSWADSTLTKTATGTWIFVRQQGTTYKFNSSGQLISVTDLAGNTTTLDYTTGKLTTVVGMGGKTVTLTYATGLVTSVTAPSGTVHYTYTTGDLTKVESPSGTTTYAYDANHFLTTATRPGGLSTINAYDANGRVNAQVNPNGATTTFSYSGDAFRTEGGTTTITSPTGEVKTEHFMDGMLTTLIVGAGTGTAVTTTYTFDPTTFGETSKAVGGGAPSTATYNAHGQVTSSTTPDGDTTTFAYTTASDGVPAGLRFCEVPPDEHAAGVSCPSYGDWRAGADTETFGTTGGELTSTDAAGNTTQYTLTTSGEGVPAGLRYCTVSPTERVRRVRCPVYGTTQPGAATETFDASGNVTSSITADGATTTTCYLGDPCAPPTAAGPQGLPEKVTNPSGTTTTDTYDIAGNLVKQVVAYREYSATTAYAYDAAGHQVCEVSPSDYAKLVRCPTSTPTPAAPPAGLTSTFYDATGKAIETVGPTGAITLTAYSPSGETYCTVAPTAAAKGVTCPAYTGLTTPTAGNDPYLGATVSVTNVLGEVTTSANALGAVTTKTYDAQGDVTSETVATGTAAAPSVTTTTSYDATGHPTSTTTGDQTTDTSYDPTGISYCTVSGTAVTNGDKCPTWHASWLTTPPTPWTAAGITLTIDDATGNPVQITNPQGQTTVTAYDPTGKPYCQVAAKEVAAGVTCPTMPVSPPTGTVTGYTTTLYDPTSKVTSVTTPTGTTTMTTYDDAGQKETVKNGSATTTYCHYGDACAATAPATGGTGTDLYSTTLPPSEGDPTGQTTTETYTPTDTPTTTTTPSVKTLDTYNEAGELTGITYATVASGYTTPSNVTSTYNPTGTLASITTATGTTTDSYDEAGDLTIQAFAPATSWLLAPYAVSYAYTPTGEPKTITYPSYGTTSDPKVTYTYGTTGEMASVTDWLGHTTSFAFDQSDSLTQTVFPNSTTETETYATSGAVTGISLAPSGSATTPLAAIAYTRNATEQVTKETDTGALSSSDSYSYDESRRLSTAGSVSISYGPATEPKTLPSGATAIYNTAGELTSSTEGSTTTTYTYDSIGARIKTEPTSGPTITYGYNALGQMTSAKSTAATGPLSGTGVTFTVNSSGLFVGESTSSKAQTFTWDMTGTPRVISDATTDFIYGPNGEVVEQLDLTTTAPTYLVHDQIGSTRILANQTGTVVGTYTYGPSGSVSSHTGTASSPIEYGGEWETNLTGLISGGDRYFDPRTAVVVTPIKVNPNRPGKSRGYNPTTLEVFPGWAEIPALATSTPCPISPRSKLMRAPTSSVTTCAGTTTGSSTTSEGISPSITPTSTVTPYGHNVLACGSGKFTWDYVGSYKGVQTGFIQAQGCIYLTAGWWIFQANITQLVGLTFTSKGMHGELKYSSTYTSTPQLYATTLCSTPSTNTVGHNVQCPKAWWYHGYYYGLIWWNNTETEFPGSQPWVILQIVGGRSAHI